MRELSSANARHRQGCEADKPFSLAPVEALIITPSIAGIASNVAGVVRLRFLPLRPEVARLLLLRSSAGVMIEAACRYCAVPHSATPGQNPLFRGEYVPRLESHIKTRIIRRILNWLSLPIHPYFPKC